MTRNAAVSRGEDVPSNKQHMIEIGGNGDGQAYPAAAGAISDVLSRAATYRVDHLGGLTVSPSAR